MAAKREKIKMPGLSSMSEYEPPTEVRINLKDYKEFQGKALKEKCAGYFEGKVTHVNQDEHSETMVIEITKLSKGEYNGGKTEDTEA